MQGPYQTLPGQTVKLVPPHRKARRRRSTTPDFHAGKRALTEKGTGGDVDGLKAAVSGGEEHRGQLMRPTGQRGVVPDAVPWETDTGWATEVGGPVGADRRRRGDPRRCPERSGRPGTCSAWYS
jgi:hypothetical protein